MQELLDFVMEDKENGVQPVDVEMEQWKKKKSDNRKRFQALQNLPYEVKVRRAEQRAIEFWCRLGR